VSLMVVSFSRLVWVASADATPAFAENGGAQTESKTGEIVAAPLIGSIGFQSFQWLAMNADLRLYHLFLDSASVLSADLRRAGRSARREKS
jgi:hypothetical protein